MNLIKVGKITTTHGIKGEVKIMGDNPCFRKDFPHALYLDLNPMIEVHIKQVKNQNGKLIIAFKEFNDIKKVEKYKGINILADKDTLDALDDNEYYIHDLIGLEVFNQNDQFRGVVKDVREYPQGFYLDLDYEGKTVLVPFIDEFIEDVADVIIIKEIEGLF